MKKLRSFPIKLALFMLSVLMIVLFAVSLAGVVYFSRLGFYSRQSEDCFVDFVYSEVSRDMYSIYSACKGNDSLDSFSSGKTNLLFAARDYKDDILHTNTTDPEILSGQNPMFEIVYIERDEGYVDRSTHIDTENGGYSENELMSAVKISARIDLNFPAEDIYSHKYALFSWCYDMRYGIYAVMAGAIILFAVFFCLLMDVTGRKNGSDELHYGVLYKVPLDLLLLVTVGGFYSLNVILFEIINSSSPDLMFIFTSFGVLILGEINAFIGLCVTVSARIKGKTILKNNLIYKVLKLIGAVLRAAAEFVKTIICNIPFIWKGALTALAIIIVNFNILLLADLSYSSSVVLWFAEMIPVFAAVLYCLVCMSRLKKGGDEIANGNISYKTDTRIMSGVFRKHGENLNSIADVTSKAVEEQLKSERMKTVLITNVSHDIKTPLTSIINYSELIITEECNCEKHSEYAEVLKRKSENLKRLLSDLVEVSKASSGALEISLEPCDAGVLIDQLYGEYEQRCREAGLELVAKPPEEQITLLTDNRKIWRVFENIMNNACKYSLSGSRVYVSAERKGDNVVLFSVRSTSAKPLDISPAELMERFVRGDKSRSTDGSGLGLSIAESLTSAQGGKMELSIDGDLFKVTLTFGISDLVQ